jgi:hypothetical protein
MNQLDESEANACTTPKNNQQNATTSLEDG